MRYPTMILSSYNGSRQGIQIKESLNLLCHFVGGTSITGERTSFLSLNKGSIAIQEKKDYPRSGRKKETGMSNEAIF